MATLAQDAVGKHGACQDDWELTVLVQLLRQWSPLSLVLEVGCDRGGTLWLWRQLGAEVIGLTLHTRQDGYFKDHGASVVVGSSTSPQARDSVYDLLNGRQPSMVFVDGGHDYETAKADIGWALDIAPRGLVVVHDVNRRLAHPEIETYLAWLEYATDRPHIVIARRGEASPGTGILFPQV